MRIIAFYDRASGRSQATNYMRSGNCDDAKTFAQREGFDYLSSEDKRNGGICFLDVCSGIESSPSCRPEFFRALSDEYVDTVVAVRFDRLCRGIDALSQLESAVRKAGKNLGYLQDAIDREFETSILRLISEYT